MNSEISNFRENIAHNHKSAEQQLSAKLLADSLPSGVTLAGYQPYLPGLDPICSSHLPKLSIGDDAMDHRMEIFSWRQSRKEAGCFE